MVLSRVGVVAFVVGVVAGCGDKAPPKAPVTEPDASIEAPTEPAPVDAGTTTPAPPVASTPPAPSEPEDPCLPVGADFEKRARPKMKDCYHEAKKKQPDLEGTVKITVDVDTLGKVRSIKVIEKTLPESTAQCMLKVVKATPFPEAGKCPGKSITIPITFPTPH